MPIPPEIDRLVVFVHIPKAGGTSFTSLMEKVYGERLLVQHPDRGWPQEWSECFHAEILRRGRDIAAFSGHAAYGVHDLFGRDGYYISIVRDPLERFVSYYNFVRHWELHHYHKASQDKSMEEFFWFLDGCNDIELYNLQCLMTSRRKEFGVSRDYVDQKFQIVIPLPRLREGIDLVSRELGWSVVEYPHLNESVREQSEDSLSDRARKKLLQGNAQDLALFDYCMSKFEARLS